MSHYKEMLDKLHDRFARGEVSEKTFLEIKARYEARIKEEAEEQVSRRARADPANDADPRPGDGPEREPEGTNEGFEDLELAMERVSRELTEKMGRIEQEIREKIEKDIARASADAKSPAGATGAATVDGSGAVGEPGKGQAPGGGRRGDVRYSGAVAVDSVLANSFRCAGACRVNGNLDATLAEGSGAVKVTGDLVAGSAEFSGACKVNGQARVGRLRTSGGFKVLGGANISDMDCSGGTGIGGSLQVQRGRASGSLEIGGPVTGDDLLVSGKVRLNAPSKLRVFNLQLNGDSWINSLEADQITVENPSQGRGFRSLFQRGGTLRADRLKATSVKVEWTTANFIEGEEVEIGPLCRVQHVKARRLRINESSRVERKEMVGASSRPGPPKRK